MGFHGGLGLNGSLGELRLHRADSRMGFDGGLGLYRCMGFHSSLGLHKQCRLLHSLGQHGGLGIVHDALYIKERVSSFLRR